MPTDTQGRMVSGTGKARNPEVEQEVEGEKAENSRTTAARVRV